jgi:hypothetical protein
MPERPPETPGLTVLDVLDGVPGLRLADRDWRALASMRHPVKVAIWLALMRPTEELFARESFIETTRADPSDPEAVSEAVSIPAVVAWAETIVRRGIRGDMTASVLIADRIEGKVGTRRDEVDPEDERRRGDIQSVIESVVTGLVNARLSQPGDDSVDITPITNSPHESMDSERQDSDTARRSEIAEVRRREEADSQARGETLAQTNDAPEERDLSDPLEGPRIVSGRTNGQANGHG